MMRAVIPVRLSATLALLGAATLLPGCGGDDAPVRRDGVLRLELTEYEISPQTLRVPEGRIRIEIHNAGILPHNVKVVDDRDREGGSSPTNFGGTTTIRSGQRTSEVLRLFPGHYRLACTVGNHENLGMYAELDVVPRS